jgi:hypothetical protein
MLYFHPNLGIFYQEGLETEKISKFYDHVEYLVVIRNILGHLAYFMVIWYVLARKSGNPALNEACR